MHGAKVKIETFHLTSITIRWGVCIYHIFWHVYVLVGAYFVWPCAPYCTIRDVTPGPLSATDTFIVYHVTHFEASPNVILHILHTYCCYAYHFYAYRLYFINVWHVYEWPKTYTWSATFILKDGRYTVTFLIFLYVFYLVVWTILHIRYQ
jgi:hypothetical protein